MRYQHVAEQIYHKPWLITPSAHASIVSLFESKLLSTEHFASKRLTAEPFEASEGGTDSFFVQRQPASLDVNGIGHIHILGVIGQGLSPIEKSCGNTDTRDVQAELASLVAQGAKGILLTIDSCGGTITGTPELAESIALVAESIPVFVFTDSQICSAAYWIASGASKIISTGSAEVGSIGVFLPWVDRSTQWEQEGIKSDPVINTGGTFKAIGFGPSLTPEQRQHLQQYVDNIFGRFTSSVVNQRALASDVIIEAATMQGQVFLGLDALPIGLVDAIGNSADAYDALLQEIDFDIDAPAPIETSEASTTTS